MKLNLDDNIYVLWRENDDGVRFVPGDDGPRPTPPEGFVYHHSEFPLMVRHQVLRLACEFEVDACDHPAESVQPTGGWIDGVEGRKCHKCLGTQTRDVKGPWPDRWESGGATPIFATEGSYFADLVLAMTRPTKQEQAIAAERACADGYEPVVPRAESVGRLGFVHPDYAKETGAKVGDRVVAVGPGPKLYPLHDAVLIATRACEGCMNVLMWEYGCEDGYPAGSEKHREVGTTCLFCVPQETIRPGVSDG